jgi:leucyl-tRNA---protein transferase
MGAYLYRTECPFCRACEPIRISVAEFEPVRTHKRLWRKGLEAITVSIGRPQCDESRVALYNKHKQERGLNQGEQSTDLLGYYEFLIDSCCETLEISYFLHERLAAVAISDRAARSLNAVYCYFDPSLSAYSLGTYNVLQQVELCRQWGLEYLYLGFYIAASPHMNYKGRFLPHERLIDGRWQRFDRQ